MKYDPFRDYLRNLPTSTVYIDLRFKEIENILNARLPKSASTYVEWWANQDYGSQAPSWLGAGFKVDGINLVKKIVWLRRDSAAKSKTISLEKKSRGKTARSNTEAPISEDILLNGGFNKLGDWTLQQGKIHLGGSIPEEPGVYAHVVDGHVAYIGSATVNLKKRLYFYKNPGAGQKTNLRINPLIREKLIAGKGVWLLAAFPEPSNWNGLPVNLIPGLEAGLVKQLSPPWNKQGKGNSLS